MDHAHDVPVSELPPGPELRDANIRLVVSIGVGILLAVLLCMWIAAALFRAEEAKLPKTTGSPFTQEGKLPPAPRLQVTPARDLITFKERQLKQVNTYGWIDQQAGIAHVPIDKAIDMVLEKGLPARATAPSVEPKQ